MARTITKIGTSSCMPCKQQSAILAPYKAILTEVDANDDPQLAMALGVSTVPTTIIYDGVTEVKRFVGLVGIGSIEKALEE